MSTYLTYRDAICFVGESQIHLHHKLILHKVFKACVSSLSKSQFYFFVKLFLQNQCMSSVNQHYITHYLLAVVRKEGKVALFQFSPLLQQYEGMFGNNGSYSSYYCITHLKMRL